MIIYILHHLNHVSMWYNCLLFWFLWTRRMRFKWAVKKKNSPDWWRISNLLTNYVLRTWTKGAARHLNSHGHHFYLLPNLTNATGVATLFRLPSSAKLDEFPVHGKSFPLRNTISCSLQVELSTDRKAEARAEPASGKWMEATATAFCKRNDTGGNGYYTAACAKTTCIGVKRPIWLNWAAYEWQTASPLTFSGEDTQLGRVVMMSNLRMIRFLLIDFLKWIGQVDSPTWMNLKYDKVCCCLFNHTVIEEACAFFLENTLSSQSDKSNHNCIRFKFRRVESVNWVNTELPAAAAEMVLTAIVRLHTYKLSLLKILPCLHNFCNQCVLGVIFNNWGFLLIWNFKWTTVVCMPLKRTVL